MLNVNLPQPEMNVFWEATAVVSSFVFNEFHLVCTCLVIPQKKKKKSFCYTPATKYFQRKHFLTLKAMFYLKFF